MIVSFGLDQQMREPVEVHCYYTTGFLITLRRVPSPGIRRTRAAKSRPEGVVEHVRQARLVRDPD